MADEARCPACLNADQLLLGKVFRPENRWWMRWLKVRREVGGFVACARCHCQYVASPAGVYEPRKPDIERERAREGANSAPPQKIQPMLAPADEPWSG